MNVASSCSYRPITTYVTDFLKPQQDSTSVNIKTDPHEIFLEESLDVVATQKIREWARQWDVSLSEAFLAILSQSVNAEGVVDLTSVRYERLATSTSESRHLLRTAEITEVTLTDGESLENLSKSIRHSACEASGPNENVRRFKVLECQIERGLTGQEISKRAKRPESIVIANNTVQKLGQRSYLAAAELLLMAQVEQSIDIKNDHILVILGYLKTIKIALLTKEVDKASKILETMKQKIDSFSFDIIFK